MMKVRLLKVATAAALGVALGGGTAYAADASPQPQPTTASITVTKAVNAPGPAGVDVQPQALTKVGGVTLRSYTRYLDRSFGYVFSGLLPTDTVTVTWSNVMRNGVVSTNIGRGTGAELGTAWWSSGHQAGWLTALAMVRRDGEVIIAEEMVNGRAVAISSRRARNNFSFYVANAHPNDRMLVKWIARDGRPRSYEGPAEDYTLRRIPGWTTATIRVFAGENRAALVAPPVSISSPPPRPSP